jgi:undecaprenyl diphosphate synthase
LCASFSRERWYHGTEPMQALLDSLSPGDEDYVLARALDPARLPRHIAIIMDGNGRWARRRHLPRVAGHRAGVKAVRVTVETCARLGLKALTLYAFSAENWKRPRAEVETLWRLLRIYLGAELPEMMRHDIRFGAIGRLDVLPGFVRAELDEVIRRTGHNRGLLLNLAINYSGRAEIVDAVKALLEDVRRGHGQNDAQMISEIDEDAIRARLYTAGLPDPDLLIRTSGEMRVSNFLLWQIAYAELYVTETLWPDFTRAELLEAILEYQRRNRRFGGLSPVPVEDHPARLEAASVPAR